MQNPNFRKIKNSNYIVIYKHAYYINLLIFTNEYDVECSVLRVWYLAKVII